MPVPVVVAIDGPAGAGKSTVARTVAERYGFTYVNSGNFYRAITLAALDAGVDPLDTGAVLRAAERASIEIREGRIVLNGVDVEERLHSDSVDASVAEHSAIPGIRLIVNRKLREAVSTVDAVIEGRDITTAVFPDAEVKIFLDASIGTRARRRFAQGVSSLTLAQIEEAIRKRDEIDRTKPLGALKLAADALYLDASDLTIDEVCEKVEREIRESGSASSRSRSK